MHVSVPLWESGISEVFSWITMFYDRNETWPDRLLNFFHNYYRVSILRTFENIYRELLNCLKIRKTVCWTNCVVTKILYGFRDKEPISHLPCILMFIIICWLILFTYVHSYFTFLCKFHRVYSFYCERFETLIEELILWNSIFNKGYIDFLYECKKYILCRTGTFQIP